MKYLILALTLLAASCLTAMPKLQDEGRDKDGHYHHPYTGEVEPDMCDNAFENTHPCECNRADMKCDHDTSKEHPSYKCKTYCRPDACKCINACTS